MATITDIFAEARALVDATSTSLTDATLLRRVNQAGNELIAKLLILSKKLKFDDYNQTDLPIGVGTLTDNRQDYALENTLLIIDRIEIKDINGDWHKISPINENDIECSLAEYESVPGMPKEYARRANSLFFYPAPTSTAVTLASGLKIYYQRGFVDFTTEDVSAGTKEPGFSPSYHFYLSYKSALPYADSYKKDRVNFIMSEIQRMEREMFDLELNKDNDKISRMIPNIESTR
jgi:hypothetical protein